MSDVRIKALKVVLAVELAATQAALVLRLAAAEIPYAQAQLSGARSGVGIEADSESVARRVAQNLGEAVTCVRLLRELARGDRGAIEHEELLVPASVASPPAIGAEEAAAIANELQRIEERARTARLKMIDPATSTDGQFQALSDGVTEAVNGAEEKLRAVEALEVRGTERPDAARPEGRDSAAER